MNESKEIKSIAWDFDWLLKALTQGSPEVREDLKIVLAILAEKGFIFVIDSENKTQNEIDKLDKAFTDLCLEDVISSDSYAVSFEKGIKDHTINAETFNPGELLLPFESAELRERIREISHHDQKVSQRFGKYIQEAKKAKKATVEAMTPLLPSLGLIRERNFFEKAQQIKKEQERKENEIKSQQQESRNDAEESRKLEEGYVSDSESESDLYDPVEREKGELTSGESKKIITQQDSFVDWQRERTRYFLVEDEKEIAISKKFKSKLQEYDSSKNKAEIGSKVMNEIFTESFLNPNDSTKIKTQHLTALNEVIGKQSGTQRVFSNTIIKLLESQKYKASLEKNDYSYEVKFLKKGQTIFIEEHFELKRIRKTNAPDKIEIENTDGTYLMRGVCRHALELTKEGTVEPKLIDVVLDYNNKRAQDLLDKREILEKIKDFFKSIFGLNEFKKIDEKAEEYQAEKNKIDTPLYYESLSVK